MLIALIILIVVLYMATYPRKNNTGINGTPSRATEVGNQIESVRHEVKITEPKEEQVHPKESPYKWWMIIAILGGSLILSLLRSIDADKYKGVPAYIGAWMGELAAPIILVVIISLIRYLFIKKEGILKFVITALLVSVILANLLLEFSR